ncbi:hypothetical protein ABZ917_22330 [Nonomuraea wenchangensis]
MTGAQSRYREVPPGELRPTPRTSGTHRHTVRQGDRLDRLAAVYYDDPLAYWRICDANPDVLSPLALVGDEPVHTLFVPVAAPAGAQWTALLRALTGTLGVRAATVVEGGVEVVHNVLVADVSVVRAAVRAAGFTPGTPAEHGRVGMTIVIPPVTGPQGAG